MDKHTRQILQRLTEQEGRRCEFRSWWYLERRKEFLEHPERILGADAATPTSEVERIRHMLQFVEGLILRLRVYLKAEQTGRNVLGRDDYRALLNQIEEALDRVEERIRRSSDE